MPPAKHILCIYLPQWAITHRFRRHREHRALPIAVIRSIGQRRLVLEASAAAQQYGVRNQTSAAEARALCPMLHLVEEDPFADRRALDALGRWLMRFSPTVSTGSLSSETLPACLFLDLSGSERLFGSMQQLVDRIQHALSRLNIAAQLALAPTPGAAWAFAIGNGKQPRMVDATSLVVEAAALPVAGLRVDQTILDHLHNLGLHTVGQVQALPREQLPARFGPELSRRLDQLLGVLAEPLIPLTDEQPIVARMEFDAPIEALEDIWRIFEKLLGSTLADLTQHNRGARQLQLLLKPDSGWGRPTITRTIALSRPHRDRKALLNLIRHEIERVDLEHGFIRFQLAVTLHEPVNEAQIRLFDPRAIEEEQELDRLIERLRARIGEKSVVQPELVESHVPERGWTGSGCATSNAGSEVRRRPGSFARKIRVFGVPQTQRLKGHNGCEAASISTPLEITKPFPRLVNDEFTPVHPPSPCTQGEGRGEGSSKVGNAVNRIGPQNTPLSPTLSPSTGRGRTDSLPTRLGKETITNRPLILLPIPIEIPVLSEPLDWRTGQPRQFTWEGKVHRVVQTVGPERIAGEWWRGHRHTRDYFDAEDESGQRFWLFRVMHTRDDGQEYPRWFLHGRFD